MTHYHISYSEDAYRWEWARDIYGDKKVSDMLGAPSKKTPAYLVTTCKLGLAPSLLRPIMTT